MSQLMPLPLTVSCFSKIQIGFTFLVPAHPGSPGKRAVKRMCVCVKNGRGIIVVCRPCLLGLSADDSWFKCRLLKNWDPFCDCIVTEFL